MEHTVLKHQVEGKGDLVVVRQAADHTAAIKTVLEMLVDENRGVISDLKEINAAGHRIVHGGEKFSTSVVIDNKVMCVYLDDPNFFLLGKGSDLSFISEPLRLFFKK